MIVPDGFTRSCAGTGRHTNEEPKPFKWTKNAAEILESIARFATRTLVAHREP